MLALADMVTVRVGEALMAKIPKGQGAVVEIRLANGSFLRETVTVADGDASRPLSRQALENKFRQFADPVIGEDRGKKLMALVDRLEQIKDVRTLTRAMR